MTGLYRIAEKNIRIDSLYNEVQDYCREYRTEGQPDFTVTITQADIDAERNRTVKTSAEQISSDAYLEELAVYRKIAERMPFYDTFLFHGSAVAVEGECYLFTAKSGTGKSTHTRLWRKLLGDRAVMVNDDKPLIRVKDNSVTVFGTPYNGKHRLGSHIAVPLKAVCILERSADNHIHSITAQQAYPMLLQQTYRPYDSAALSKTLTLIDNMKEQVSFWRLGCNRDISAAELSYQAMKG